MSEYRIVLPSISTGGDRQRTVSEQCPIPATRSQYLTGTIATPRGDLPVGHPATNAHEVIRSTMDLTTRQVLVRHVLRTVTEPGPRCNCAVPYRHECWAPYRLVAPAAGFCACCEAGWYPGISG